MLHLEQQETQRFSRTEKERRRTAATGDIVAKRVLVALAACGAIAAKELMRLIEREVPGEIPGKVAAKSDIQF